MSRIFFINLVVTASFCYGFKAHAWWSMGHRIIGYIVEKEIAQESELKKALQVLLDSKIETFTLKEDLTKFNNISDATVWLDFAKHKHRQDLFRCHFIDIPFTEKDLTNPDSFDEKNIAKQIAEIRTKNLSPLNIINCSEKALFTLASYWASPTKETEERASISLRYLLHLVGDMHQPLHMSGNVLSNGKNDEGGNKLLFRSLLEVDNYNGRRAEAVNFHMLWDAGLGVFPQEDKETIWQPDEKRLHALEELYRDLSVRNPGPFQDSKVENFSQWVIESHIAAKKIGYSDIVIRQRKNHPYYIDFTEGFEAYQQKRKNFVLNQIWIAGKRLGWLLKSVYKDKCAHPFVQAIGPNIF